MDFKYTSNLSSSSKCQRFSLLLSSLLFSFTLNLPLLWFIRFHVGFMSAPRFILTPWGLLYSHIYCIVIRILILFLILIFRWHFLFLNISTLTTTFYRTANNNVIFFIFLVYVIITWLRILLTLLWVFILLVVASTSLFGFARFLFWWFCQIRGHVFP